MTKAGETTRAPLRGAIVIRRRTLNETRNLAIRFLCLHFKRIVFFYAILALPVYLLDLALWTALLPSMSALEVYASLDELNLNVVFFEWLTISLETLFVGSLTTQYLGRRLFASDESVSNKEVFKLWWERRGQIFYYLIATRAIRVRSFYAEIILLERSPFFARSNAPSTRMRGKRLNHGAGPTFDAFVTEYFYLAPGAFAGIGMLLCILVSVVPDPFVSFLSTNYFIAPVFLFGCRLFNVVFNFFQYVNYRVAREGWDIAMAFQDERAALIAELEDSEDSSTSAKRSERTLRPTSLERELTDLELVDVPKEDGQ